MTELFPNKSLGSLMDRLLNYQKINSPAKWGCNNEYNGKQKKYASDDGIASLEVYNKLLQEFVKNQGSAKAFVVSSLVDTSVNENKSKKAYKNLNIDNKERKKRLQAKECRLKRQKYVKNMSRICSKDDDDYEDS